MTRLFKTLSIAVLAAFLAVPAALASPATAEEEEFSAVHHSADSNYLDFKPFGIVELPRIFLVRRAGGSFGLDAYASTASALRSGDYRAKSGGHGGGSDSSSGEGGDHGSGDQGHGNVSSGHGGGGSAEAMIAEGSHLGATLVPAGGGHVVVDFSITKHLIFALLAALLVAGVFIALARRYKRGVGRETAPKGTWQNMLETVIVFVRDEMARPALGNNYRSYLPYILSVFFFILVCNLMGMVPFGATATSNITVTAVLAVFTFIVTQFNASSDHWKEVLGAEAPWWLAPIMIPIEIIGLFTKPFALAVRLFANMTAGHLVILSLIGLIFTMNDLFGASWGVFTGFASVAFSLFIFTLEILVAFIQAYVFAMLSALFIGMAIEEHGDGAAEMMDEADPSQPMQRDERRDISPSLLSGNHDEEEEELEQSDHSLQPAPA